MIRRRYRARVFFGLWPSPETRGELARRRASISVAATVRPVVDGNLHLTLHFIGKVCAEELRCLRRQAGKVVAPAFDITIDRQGFFSKPQIVWLGCRVAPKALLDLHSRLAESLRICHFEPEARAFQPHITMLRKIPEAPAAAVIEPLRWRVDDFAIIESKITADGVKYQPIDTYPLI